MLRLVTYQVCNVAVLIHAYMSCRCGLPGTALSKVYYSVAGACSRGPSIVPVEQWLLPVIVRVKFLHADGKTRSVSTGVVPVAARVPVFLATNSTCQH